LNCANALASDPVFPLEDYDAASLFSPPTRSGRAELQGSLLSFDGKTKDSVTRSQALGMDLIDDLINIKKLAAINAESHERRNPSDHDTIQYSDKLFQTERRLLTRSNASGPGKFITSCCIAATIFIDNHLRGIHLHARLIDRLVARLQVSMHFILSGVSIPSLSLNTSRASKDDWLFVFSPPDLTHVSSHVLHLLLKLPKAASFGPHCSRNFLY
jgi:hypothetical protein